MLRRLLAVAVLVSLMATAAPGVAAAEHREFVACAQGADQPTSGGTSSGAGGGTAPAAVDQVLIWDVEGHLGEVRSAGVTTARMAYGADGTRRVRVEGATTTVYLGDGTELIARVGASEVDARRYSQHAGAVVAVRTGNAQASVSTLLSDPGGTAEHAMANVSGEITTRLSLPFGAPRAITTRPAATGASAAPGTSTPTTPSTSTSGTNTPGGAWPGESGFVGGTIDTATGLTHIGARPYDPELGAFISVDPLLNPLEARHLNGYAYGFHNPTTYADETGLCSSPIAVIPDVETCGGATQRHAQGGGTPGSQPTGRVEQGPAVTYTAPQLVAHDVTRVMHQSSRMLAQLQAAATAAAHQAGNRAWHRTYLLDPLRKAGEVTYDFTARPVVDGCLTAGTRSVSGCVVGAGTTFVPAGKGVSLALKGLNRATDAVRAANTGRLTSRADELSGVLDPIARNSRTSAVLGTRQGRDVLAGGGRDLSPAQRALAREGDVVARGPGLHAEVTAVNGARSAGLTPQGIGVSRPICPACISFLEDAGATITGPNSAWWY